MTQYLHITTYIDELETELRKYTLAGWELVSHTALDAHVISLILKKQFLSND